MKRPGSRQASELTSAQVAAGAKAAARNARELIEDAKLLFAAGRYARGTALAILAIEEADKPWILAWIAASPTEEMRGKHWRAFRDHVSKNVTGAVLTSMLRRFEAEGLPAGPAASLIAAMKNGPRELDDLKQAGFYMAVTDAGGWVVPSDCFSIRDEVLAEIAEGKVEAAEASPFSSPDCVDLFKAHVGPVMETPGLGSGMAEFARHALALGLCSEAWAAAIKWVTL